MRTRSSLTGERVKKDPAFRKTMQFAGLLAKASRIGSAVYALVPADRKQHSLYRKLTGEAMTWLKYQWKETDIIEYLTKQYAGQEKPVSEPRVTVLRTNYHPPRPGLRSTLPDVVKTTPVKRLSRHLRAWRQQDKEFRRQYNQTFREYVWGEGIKEAGKSLIDSC
ncbi:hypothetical protein HB364_10425 [Pseudoflavitalea sp. X16]|uniref:hypothetical protein n=1 Tax=Paraflavitalea devenefica TaxID=2716334 RepID=UPI0014200B70|nr:hypothetical protein [Paraflavitalea devenefica]NII25499.1 hypothetical protein [Paraflavitalea devenefica]